MYMSDDNPYKNDESDRKAAKDMDDISKTLFAPVYPMIAEYIKDKFNITTGCCIDIGSGPAALSIALAKVTDLDIHALDASAHVYDYAQKNISQQGLKDRITPVIGKVEDMPFDDNFASLIVSRGSIFFWDNLKAAFNEIFRVLKPGGQTCIGGGFGNAQLKETIFREMAKKDPGFQEKSKARFSPDNLNKIRTAIEQSDIASYDIYQGDKGLWIHITKES